MRIIGDVHGKVDRYQSIIADCETSICVGDFGFKAEWDWYYKNIAPIGFDKPYRHLINMGNHDYLPYVGQYPSLGHYAELTIENKRIFTVRGADSIDKHLRLEGVDWFPDEELSYSLAEDALESYIEFAPEIVISHDCPQHVMEMLFGHTDKSLTRNLLQAMYDEWAPDLWIFGHHHKSIDVEFDGCRFICLNELEFIDF